MKRPGQPAELRAIPFACAKLPATFVRAWEPLFAQYDAIAVPRDLQAKRIVLIPICEPTLSWPVSICYSSLSHRLMRSRRSLI
jgi:hypothetical protein